MKRYNGRLWGTQMSDSFFENTVGSSTAVSVG